MLTKEKLSSIAGNYKTGNDNLILEKIDEALETAHFYGFVPIKCPPVSKEDTLRSKDFETNPCLSKTAENFDRCHRLDNKICLLRNYVEKKFNSFSFPLMICYRDSKINNDGENSYLNLSILGAEGSIAEALVIKASLAILEKNTNLKIEINSVGDKESFGRFEKDLISHLRKYSDGDLIDPHELIKKEFKTIPKDETEDDLWVKMPKPMTYLSPLSIKHYKEVLEYLESFEVQYDLNHYLIPNRQYCHQTIFQIKDGDEILGLGLRHENISRKLNIRRDIPLLTVVLRDNLGNSKKINIMKSKPRFFLVQFGNKAKAKSLFVIDLLRKARIPLKHLLVKDKLLGQLTAAENLNTPYILIIGEKEALENSILVRNMETRVQETVSLPELVNYLRKIKI